MFVPSGIILVICAASLFRNTAAATCGAVTCTDTKGVCDAVADICWCIAGFHGAACVTPCDAACTTCTGATNGDCVLPTAACPTNPCAATGTCTTYDDATVIGTDVKCRCDAGYSGANCDILDCAAGNPCMNGGTCDDSATPNTCTCATDTYGATCQHVCPDCAAGSICYYDGTSATCTACPTCTVYQECISGTTTPACACRDGLSVPPGCATIGCTAGNPCLNGGTCNAAAGPDTCTCPTTHTGALCQHACPTDAAACDDVYKMCKTNVGNTAAECACKPGLSGPDCTIVGCATGINPCLNGGTCNATPEPDECTCPTTHTGALCQDGDTPCVDGAPCLNGGTCADGACTCDVTHTGDTCQLTCDPACTGDANCTEDGEAGKCLAPCVDGAPCLNGGTCADAACTCDATKYAGNTCQLTCTPACTGEETCKEEAGAGKCSGAATIVASVALILAAVTRRFF